MITSRRSLVLGAGALAFNPGRAAFSAPTDTLGLYLPHAGAKETDFGVPDQLAAMRGDEEVATDVEASKEKLDLSNARVVDALSLISERARGRSLVILNEAHNVSRCRAFGEKVALRLRNEGFDTFAAETFSNLDNIHPLPAFEAGGPCTWALGYYTDDPVFAEFVRSVRDAGYRLAAYEQRKDQIPNPAPIGRDAIPAREEAEATNLAALIANRPNARIFVYCGYSHAMRKPIKGNAWMAARLAKMTGIEPLSIEQSFGWPTFRPQPDAPVDQVLARFPITHPAAVMQSDGSPIAMKADLAGDFDIQVVHPRLTDVDGRPGWLADAYGRTPTTYNLPTGIAAGSLIQAVRLNEVARDQAAVPSDQYPFKGPGKTATFFLKPGRYQVRVETPGERRVLGEISVS